ncbi:MAG: hypothetical protein ACE5FL_00020 [Myxococcota bacterium]
MSRSTHVLVLGALIALSAVVAVRRAAACSVCFAGDPLFSTQGTTAQEEGTFSVYLEGRGWEKKSGVLPHEEGQEGDGEEQHDEEERNKGRRLDLYLSWTPIDRVTVTLDVPWVSNEITEVKGNDKSTSHLSGLGDLILQSSVVLWRNRDVLPSTWFEGRALLKFPTGASSQRVDGVKDPHLQLGTGSWDFGFGLGGVHRFEWGSLYTSVSYRVDTEGSLDYEYGDVFLANTAVVVPLGHAFGVADLNPFTVGFQLNFRYADFDEFRGDHYDDSGGSILYLTPSLSARLPWPGARSGPTLRTSVQIPATSGWLHGFQQEDPIWFVGLQYTF